MVSVMFLAMLYFCSYTIDYENTDEEKKFKVEHDSSNRRNGRIRLRNLLDREVTEEYILHILAVDRGKPFEDLTQIT